jgi:hypothetical protein
MCLLTASCWDISSSFELPFVHLIRALHNGAVDLFEVLHHGRED